ncbi:DUF4450 domain-containing protein [Chondrinema litorale]|uniref:DUF4450 domain-containing protein n=1 Tax=Chondrinema litorale TaxID=2994555 RepID=UPI00254303BA|nr:DUF4450 domain-containing protein [Chondrinema litorale]UZR98831.1 DUF4450 domain-containing protein [Chondrinema litorale]
MITRHFKISNNLLAKILLIGIFCCLYACENTVREGNNVQENTDNRKWWHRVERSVRYQPDGEDFVINNGDKRFNRALYGTNTAYRVEAGDLPEFAQYLPGMGGNMKFGLIKNGESKWLIDAENIEARYRPGSMLYVITDPILGKGKLHLTVLAMAEVEGMLVKAEFEEVDHNIQLFWTFGGVSGKKFSRNGDIGADPESSFYLKPEYCESNFYQVDGNQFQVYFNTNKETSKEDFAAITKNFDSGTLSQELKEKKAKLRKLTGIFPETEQIKITDANQQNSPEKLFESNSSAHPIISGIFKNEEHQPLYFSVFNPETISEISYNSLATEVEKAEAARKKLSQQIYLSTPDPYLNTLGAALSVAEDGVWEDPTYLHGAVAWRMRIPGWRAAYAADRMGRHDRSRMQFESYLKSQVTSPEVGPVVPDTTKHFARQKEEMGTAMFSSGYICRNPNGDFRPHHYDMNLVFIDQLLWNICWTGDMEFAKSIWPALQRHLDWEKRNYDMDGDGLYDAYCCIWASDGLQYSGGGVTHSSSYNYKANKLAAEIARKIGENPTPYQTEADKIQKAIQDKLWISETGQYAEYKDLLGLQETHPAAGLWTVYHTLDSDVPDPFQAYQTMRYVDTQIPHIPVEAKGLPENTFQLVSTTNWIPYTWSINNVALAEVLHTSLAYWQANRSDKAFQLWKSALMESMYLSSSPGGFGQLSFYDAIRGELYRDFSDPIGMAARTLVEGLFGVLPNALENTLTIQPGFPETWEHAELRTPDIHIKYQQNKLQETWSIKPSFPTKMNLKLQLKALATSLEKLTVNGKYVKWKSVVNAIGKPTIELDIDKNLADKDGLYYITVDWKGEKPARLDIHQKLGLGEMISLEAQNAEILELFDPQNAFSKPNKKSFNVKVEGKKGHHTAFVKLKEGDLTWWQPLDFKITDAIEILASEEQESNKIGYRVVNHTNKIIKGKLRINPGTNDFEETIELQAGISFEDAISDPKYLKPGTNILVFTSEKGIESTCHIVNWDISQNTDNEYLPVDLSGFYNDKVTQIFQNKYLSPRPESPTLQLPWQGIGNWCYPLIEANIDDSGLRNLAKNNQISLPFGAPLATPSGSGNNIIFTSQWDNYPKNVSVPLTGKASHIYLMMAGSTNPMQSRFTNGVVEVEYEDGSLETLELNNPETWWPIEQDYYQDGYAFNIDYPKPYRVHLKSGLITRDFKEYTSLKGFSDFVIDGGAATILDLSLNPKKTLKQLTVKALANDVVIGLMSATLVSATLVNASDIEN